eukprot:1157821-Pelagomonas_calceolata.AAC.7
METSCVPAKEESQYHLIKATNRPPPFAKSDPSTYVCVIRMRCSNVCMAEPRKLKFLCHQAVELQPLWCPLKSFPKKSATRSRQLPGLTSSQMMQLLQQRGPCKAWHSSRMGQAHTWAMVPYKALRGTLCTISKEIKVLSRGMAPCETLRGSRCLEACLSVSIYVTSCPMNKEIKVLSRGMAPYKVLRGSTCLEACLDLSFYATSCPMIGGKCTQQGHGSIQGAERKGMVPYKVPRGSKCLEACLSLSLYCALMLTDEEVKELVQAMVLC